ncbi:MAG: hypothetical protein KF873_05210 [Gemmataceae bacterium]|nr:hypothetical protein [Planctomycetia bacterium]MBX3398117.1 hypothetical protein [Gemmataceae bacterium]
MATMQVVSSFEDAVRRLGERVELIDADGRLIGYFVAPDEYRRLAYQFANALVTDVELDASRRTPGGSTTEELLNRLAATS